MDAGDGTIPQDRRVSTNDRERRAIQRSGESLRALAARYGINPKTAAKWKNRESTADLPRGPKLGKHQKLTAEEVSIIVQFREHTMLPLDDCLYALQTQIPHLSRSTLHRCLKQHGVSRLVGRSHTRTAISLGGGLLGDVHIDHSQVHSKEGSHHLFNAVEQASKLVFVQMGSRGGGRAAAHFLGALLARHPCRIKRVFTSDAEPFSTRGQATQFSRLCQKHGIEHCLIEHADPVIRGPSSEMGHILQDGVIFPSEAYLLRLLERFVNAYNYRRRYKALGGMTPHSFLCRAWTQQPDHFVRDPHHELLGLDFAPR